MAGNAPIYHALWICADDKGWHPEQSTKRDEKGLAAPLTREERKIAELNYNYVKKRNKERDGMICKILLRNNFT